MRDSFRLHTTQWKYWGGIMSTILIFGSALGYVGAHRAAAMPKLSLTSTEHEQRFGRIETKITDLDVRLTHVEQKDQPAVASNKAK